MRQLLGKPLVDKRRGFRDRPDDELWAAVKEQLAQPIVDDTMAIGSAVHVDGLGRIRRGIGYPQLLIIPGRAYMTFVPLYASEYRVNAAGKAWWWSG